MNRWFGKVGTGDALPDDMPALYLMTDASCGEERAKFIAAGCEEEGIPLAWDVKTGSAAELARLACLRSQLEVGIGIDSAGNAAIAMVTVAEKPYVERPAETPEQLRWLGQAAARMSQSQPIVEENKYTAERKSGQTAAVPTYRPALPAERGESDIAFVVEAVIRELLRFERKGEVADNAR